jgi:acetyl esterase/lipase
MVTLWAASAAFGQTAPNPGGQAASRRPPAGPPQAQQVTWEKGAQPATMLPDSSLHPTVLLWPQGAPGSEGKTEDETYRIVGDLMVISNVHRPSITLYLPPKEKATGAGVIVTPGGANREIWVTSEGYRVAEWLSQRGIAAFVLKYRLPRAEGSTYTTEDHSLPDIQRAIRLVRSRAAEWRVDPDRVGVMGFSAGGFLAGLAGARYNDPVKRPVDSVDKLSAKPAFMALIYGTPFAGPMQADAKITKDLPPTFLCAGSDDRIAASYPDVFKALKAAGVPVELHMFGGVGHGFAIKLEMPAVAPWPELFRTWLSELGMLGKR